MMINEVDQARETLVNPSKFIWAETYEPNSPLSQGGRYYARAYFHGYTGWFGRAIALSITKDEWMQLLNSKVNA